MSLRLLLLRRPLPLRRLWQMEEQWHPLGTWEGRDWAKTMRESATPRELRPQRARSVSLRHHYMRLKPPVPSPPHRPQRLESRRAWPPPQRALRPLHPLAAVERSLHFAADVLVAAAARWYPLGLCSR